MLILFILFNFVFVVSNYSQKKTLRDKFQKGKTFVEKLHILKLNKFKTQQQ